MTQNRRRCVCGNNLQHGHTYCSISCGLRHAKPSREVECKECGNVFGFNGRGRRWYCDDCRKIVTAKLSHAHRAKTGQIQRPGVGSGGNQWGERNPAWKGGVGKTKYKSNYRHRCFRVWPRSCVICDSQDRLQTHHINGDPDNYSTSNLVPVCHTCHWKIHYRRSQSPSELWERFLSLFADEARRSKIAEKIGELSKAETIRGEGSG